MKLVNTLVVLVVIGLTSGCASTSLNGVEKEAPVSVIWHQVDDPHKECSQKAGTQIFKILGCSYWNDEEKIGIGVEEKGRGRVCHIYAKKPESHKDVQRFATLGHEMMHCFEGQWHDKFGRMNEDWKPNREKLQVNAEREKQ